MKVKLLTVLISSLILLPARGQVKGTFEEFKQQKLKEFNNYRDQKRKEFDEYRRKKNAEFASYLGKTWEVFSVEKAVEPTLKPNPVKPTIAPQKDPNILPEKPVGLPEGKVIVTHIPQPATPLEIPLPKEPNKSPYARIVNLFGTPVELEINPSLKFKMNGCEEKETERIWNLLNKDAFDGLFFSCEQLRRDMNLNGWGLLNLCRIASEELEGIGTNEAVVLQTYLLTQFGYDARLARISGNRLVMLCPADMGLARISYLLLNGKKYYIWQNIKQDVSLHSYKQNCADATNALSMANTASIQLSDETLPPMTFSSKWDKEASVTVNTKKSLMAYYENMPQMLDFSFYASQMMDEDMSRQMLPTLRNAIIGKEELNAVNILLHFVQTAFEYKTDEEQFGYERSFFKEELFYYPFSDCEDRAILFSHLVRQLMGLDVVLLQYPNHACTAVKFKTNVAGDYVMVKGQKFIICDPTYINANVGMCMDNYKGVEPIIHSLN